MHIEPIRVPFDPAVMDDLRERLGRTRWPDQVGRPWESGTDLDYLRELAGYWVAEFDWGAQVERLNQFPHFRARVQGLGIHFLHQRGRGPNPIPLIVSHGWPGSFLEMLKILPLLTDPARFGGDPAEAFDVIVPSLPGYGLSDRPGEPGTDPRRIARLWRELMVDGLGYQRFGAQGGDWGASVTTRLALLAPGELVGIHLNYIPGSYRPDLGGGAPRLSEAEARFIEQCERWSETEGGYAHIQRTKPQTLAYGLTDSPAGLAAWIIEKLRSWSDCGGELGRRFDRDEVLTAVMLYWTTGTIGSSMRLYREASAHPLRFGPGERVQVPCGVALFPAETPANPPREWVERVYNVCRWTEMPRGGHFAAWEEPELLAQDIREFFRGLR
jgi:pimeloyl-ACP methyl ester carboxylesterase